MVWQIRILKSASLSLCGHARRLTAVACFVLVMLVMVHFAQCSKSCRQKWPCSSSIWQWHVAPGVAGIFAFRAAFPTIAGRCVDVPVVVHVLVYGVMRTVEVPQFLLALGCPVPGQGCCYARLFFTTLAHGSRRLENVRRCRRCSSAWLWTSL